MRPSSMPTDQERVSIATPFTADEVRQIDDVRFSLRHATRRETIRFLIKKGLEATADARAPS